jgi:ATP-dependent Clp protease adaptor protein ClpS
MLNRFSYLQVMMARVEPATGTTSPSAVGSGAGGTSLPGIEKDRQTDSRDDLAPGYLVICWNDPINLMDYVTHVFRKVFGWAKPKAEQHMLQVHHQGKSVLTRESLERAEHYVHQLQGYGLQATMERD